MKVLFTDYTFNSTNKTVTFNTKNVINLNNILLITNVTRNIIIYNFANPSLGGTLSNNVLTLTYNTTTMSSSDLLQIFLDLGEHKSRNSIKTSTIIYWLSSYRSCNCT